MKLWNRNFILLMQGAFVSNLGNAVYSFAIGYYVYQLTGSESMLGLFSSITMLCFMLLGPVAGALADRLDRKGLIVWMDAVRGVIMLGIGWLCITNKLTTGLLMLITVVIAVAGAFFSPAYSSVTVDIVPPKELARARSIESSGNMIVKVTSTALGGMLVAVLGVGPLILFNGVSFLLSAFSEIFIRVPVTPKQSDGTTISPALLFADLRQGMSAVLHTRGLNVTFFLLFIVNFLCSGVFSLLLVISGEKGFDIMQHGVLATMMSVGGLVGALFVSAVPLSGRWRLRLAFWGFFLMMPLSIIFMLVDSFWVSAVLLMLVMLGNSVGNIFTDAGMMLMIPESSRATIIGVVMASSLGGSALSNIFYGVLAEQFSLRYVGAIGLAIAILPTVLLFANAEVRRAIVAELPANTP